MRRNYWRAGLAMIVAAGMAAFAQAAPAQTVVEFESGALHRAVVEALGLEPGTDVLDTDMLRLTALSVIYRNIGSLDGLQYALNLEELNLSGGLIADLLPLSDLGKLRVLRLAENSSLDLAELENLDQLVELGLSRCPGLELAPLVGMTQLETLYLDESELSNLSVLSGLIHLRKICLSKNNVHDIAPLAGLEQIEFLDLSENPVESAAPLADLRALTHLYMNEVSVSDWQPLASLVNLTEISLRANKLQQIDFLAELRSLSIVDLTGNEIGSVQPLENATDLTQLRIGSNNIEDVTPLFTLSRLDGLRYIELEHNNLNRDSLCVFIPGMAIKGTTVFVSSVNGRDEYGEVDFTLVCSDPDGDTDRDNLTNIEEANLGTLPENPDTDADGHTDGAENLAGSSPIDSGDVPGSVLVEIADPDLDYSIRREIDRPKGPIFKHHLEQLTEISVTCGVASFEGLQYAINLEKLSANCGAVSDLSPILGLHKLSSLSLDEQNIEVLPDLSSLAGLKVLNLSDNHITDISPLQALTGLESLALNRNPIGSLVSLGALHSLERLELNDCGISDASPIGQLTQLSLLHMNNNPLDNINFLGMMPNVQALQLEQCGITDIQPLAALETVGVLSLRDNLIEDISPLRKVARIQVLNLSNNRIHEISALSGHLSLLMLYLEGNEISSVGPLAYLRILLRLDLSDNRIERAPALGFLRIMGDLDLSSNLLSSINFLRGVRGLTTLNLSHNRIERIGILRAKLELKSVNLTDNRIKDPSPALASYLPIQSLRLQGNEISNLDAYVRNPYTTSIQNFRRNPIPQEEFCLGLAIKQESEDEQYVNHLEVICNDPEGDLDGDGLANYDEFIAGSALDDPDTDYDGFSDGEEVAAGSYPWHRDSIPIENPNTTPLPEMASILLAQYDTITTAPNRARLFYADCQVALPGMTYQSFEALDENGSDGLSVWELELHVPKDTGCNLTEDGGANSTSQQRGDLSVLGVLLVAMALVRARRVRRPVDC